MMTENESKQIKSDMRSSLPEGRLHFAAHSHHPWPDVTQTAQNQYWVDSTKWLDSKWSHIFANVLPQSRQNVAELLGIKNKSQIIEGTNTFEFVSRLFSCLDFVKPIRILTTDSEFYSFTRVSRRLAENSNIEIDYVKTFPFNTFEDRFAKKAQQKKYDLIFSSLVFFNSGFYATRLLEKLLTIKSNAIIGIDLYHAFGAVPLELEEYAQSFFFLGGGYKYISAGEGACFMTVPENSKLRPWQTGWFADYKALEEGVNNKIDYASDAHRFAGATYDPTPWYRLNAVMSWWQERSLTPERIHTHARLLQKHFLELLAKNKTQWSLEDVLGFSEYQDWGNFLCLKTTQPQKIVNELREKNVFIDARDEYVRFGFGYYQTKQDINDLFEVLKK